MINIKRKPSTFGYGEVLNGRSNKRKFDFRNKWNSIDIKERDYKSSIKEK